ncbi:MAG: S9 family peptidase, partial [Edaphobacter sp.]
MSLTSDSTLNAPDASTSHSYPKARTVEQTDDYFGTTVSDPYRWMEDVDSAELKTWIDAENELTQQYLAKIPARERMQQRLMELIDFERYTAPSRRGTRYFYSYNSGLQNQNVLYWQEGLDGEPKVLLDPNTFSADGTVAISGISITDDGLLAAYSIADAGSDWMKWHVRNVTTGEDLPDVVEWSKFSGASWLKDGSGFFYARYDAPAADASEAEALKTANYFHKIYFHKLGTQQSEDKLIFDRPDDGELNLGAVVTDDGRYLVLHQSKGTSPNNELSVKDLARPDAPILKLIDTADATYAPINNDSANDGTLFWLLTTLDAPNGKVISIDLNQPAREHWKTVIPESENKLSDISMIDNTFIANYLADAQSRV